ncbi:hypothetical protein K439DRAFT_1627469 [Ramaria rubella]|nr:hypothetical protein K439DRAFT_1627469 [Ramaria rubella]
MVTVSEKLEPGDQLPPTYTESTISTDSTTLSDISSQDPPPSAGASSSGSTAPPLSPPTNFLTIFRPNQSVKGSYTIDPSLPVPPGTTPSNGSDGKQLNARLASQNGAVDVTIELRRSGDSKGPARLEASSHNGSVTVAVHDARLNRFRLHAASQNGSVTVRLPPTFEGSISTNLEWGKLVFSTAIQARLTTFSENGSEGRFFVGDYAGSGYENEETWLGDHLRAQTRNGRVRISFLDEPNVTEARGGFLGRLFS